MSNYRLLGASCFQLRPTGGKWAYNMYKNKNHDLIEIHENYTIHKRTIACFTLKYSIFTYLSTSLAVDTRAWSKGCIYAYSGKLFHGMHVSLLTSSPYGCGSQLKRHAGMQNIIWKSKLSHRFLAILNLEVIYKILKYITPSLTNSGWGGHLGYWESY